MGSSIAKQDRIGARVPHDVYETLLHAAKLTGATVNQFLVQAALKEAHAVIEREEILRPSSRDWGWIMERLENPPQPTDAMKNAMKRYQEARQDDEGTSFSWNP